MRIVESKIKVAYYSQIVFIIIFIFTFVTLFLISLFAEHVDYVLTFSGFYGQKLKDGNCLSVLFISIMKWLEIIVQALYGICFISLSCPTLPLQFLHV